MYFVKNNPKIAVVKDTGSIFHHLVGFALKKKDIFQQQKMDM